MSRGIFRGIMWFLLLAGLAIFAFGQYIDSQFQQGLANLNEWREVSPTRARFLLNAIWLYNNPLFSPLTKDVNLLYRTEPGWKRDPADFLLPKQYSSFTDFVFGYQTANGEEFTSPTLPQEEIPTERLKHLLNPKEHYKRGSDSLTLYVFTKQFKQNDTVFMNAMVVNRIKWQATMPKLIELALQNTTFDHWFDSSFVVRNNTLKNSQEHLVYLECKSGNEIVFAKGVDSLRANPHSLTVERVFGDKDTVKVYASGIMENRAPLLREGVLVLTLIGFVLVVGSVISLSKL